MRKLLLSTAMMFAMCTANVCAQDVVLPQPKKDAKMTLMESLQQRKSVREFSKKEIDDQTLSDLLWAACGVNRPEEKMITAPSAMNKQDIKVYVLKSSGVWLYMPIEHKLKKISDENLISTLAGRQVSVADAPVFLMLVSDQTGSERLDTNLGNIDAGYVSQNICLACTALGLATVPRGARDRDILNKALGLNDRQLIVLNHPIGYPVN